VRTLSKSYKLLISDSNAGLVITSSSGKERINDVFVRHYSILLLSFLYFMIIVTLNTTVQSSTYNEKFWFFNEEIDAALCILFYYLTPKLS
jgi:hypothetical protein